MTPTQGRSEAHDLACEALIRINKMERALDADSDARHYAPDEFARWKRRLAETRIWVMAEYRRLNAAIDAKDKGSQP
jgi:hypothetical protein